MLGFKYSYAGEAHLAQIDPAHPWFTGEPYLQFHKVEYKIYGWYPGNGSKNLLRIFKEDELNSALSENQVPSDQKRKIRIIDTEIEKG